MRNIFHKMIKVILLIALSFLFSCASTQPRHFESQDANSSNPPKGGGTGKGEDEVLRCFTDTYVLIQREYMGSPTFLDNFENTLKGVQSLLGKERLSYTKTAKGISISSFGETIKVDDMADELQKMKEFARTFSFVQKTNPQFDLSAIIYAATKGIAKVDPYSTFWSRDEFKEIVGEVRKNRNEGISEGIGVEIAEEEGVITVGAVIENAPAFKAGILPEDKIIMIEGRPTEGLSIMECEKKLRGPKGTDVTITIMREGLRRPEEITITRDIATFLTVRSEMQEKHYGYIRISQFRENTDTDFTKAVNTLEEENKGDIKGLILDLRYSPGGLLDQSVKLADRFIESGLIISLFGKERIKE